MNAGEREGLRRLAEAATPGPWRTSHAAPTHVWADRDPAGFDAFHVAHCCDAVGRDVDSADAAYIAAANPAAMLSLLDALEVAERKIVAVEALADEWERPGPKVQGTPEDAAAAIRAALAAENTAELPPRTHKTAPVSDSGPESGQGDHRDDEGRSGAQEEGK